MSQLKIASASLSKNSWPTSVNKTQQKPLIGWESRSINLFALGSLTLGIKLKSTENSEIYDQIERDSTNHEKQTNKQQKNTF